MVADQSVPAASGTVHAERDKDNQNTKLDVKVNNLARPSNLNRSATTYLVWIRPSGGAAVKQGAIGVDKNLKGEMHTVTVAKNCEIFITPEQSGTVTVPSEVEVLPNSRQHGLIASTLVNSLLPRDLRRGNERWSGTALLQGREI